jgi:hypothetical protein
MEKETTCCQRLRGPCPGARRARALWAPASPAARCASRCIAATGALLTLVRRLLAKASRCPAANVQMFSV